MSHSDSDTQMVTICLFVRPVTVESHRPSLPRTHAQRLARHLPSSKPTRSAEKADVDVTWDTAVSCPVQSVTKPASLVEKPTSVEPKESVTLPRSNSAELTQDDERELQQKKDALRLAFYPLCLSFVAGILAMKFPNLVGG